MLTHWTHHQQNNAMRGCDLQELGWITITDSKTGVNDALWSSMTNRKGARVAPQTGSWAS
jgi:hypothetical protein